MLRIVVDCFGHVSDSGAVRRHYSLATRFFVGHHVLNPETRSVVVPAAGFYMRLIDQTRTIEVEAWRLPLFWAKVNKRGEDECWEWTAYKGVNGYGQFSLQQEAYLAHRIAYTLCVGPIPHGMSLDHLCMNAACCNPGHMRVCTLEENSAKTSRSVKDHCKRGHRYTRENTYLDPKKHGARDCRECKRERRWRMGATRHVKLVSAGDKQYIADARKRGVSGKDLAAQFGISEQYVCGIYRGYR